MDSLYCNVAQTRKFGGFVRSIFSKQRVNYSMAEANKIEDFLEVVKAARQELENVQRLFNNAADPDLIEYAIYEEHAAKLKFSYLIKKAKENNIRVEGYTFF